MINKDELFTVVPIGIDDYDYFDKEKIIEVILEMYNDYGIKCFGLCCPNKGFRSVGYPSKEYYAEIAKNFKEIKEELNDYKDIILGWWNILTIKNGGSFEPIVKANGQEHAFSSCPLDPEFIKRFSEDIAMFAAVAKPAL